MKTPRFVLWTILAFVLVLAFTLQSRADGIMKVVGQSSQYLLPKKVQVRTIVKDQIAQTVSRQTFVHDSPRSVKVQYAFPTNSASTVTHFRVLQRGEWRVALAQSKTPDTVNANPGGSPDLAFQDLIGNSPFVFSLKDTIVQGDTVVAEISYIELLPYSIGLMNFNYPFGFHRFANSSTEIPFSMSIEFNSTRGFTKVVLPPSLNWSSTNTANLVSATAEQARLSTVNDLLFQVELNSANMTASLLSNKPSDEDGYFAFIVEPDTKDLVENALPKTFTFIIDCSGSMGTHKMNQAKEAATWCIQRLNPRDQFNVVAFEDRVWSFMTVPVTASIENVAAGTIFISKLMAGGGTNLQGSLGAGLSQFTSDETINIIIFLTDGIASLDLGIVKKQNIHNTRIFVFGVGSDVNKTLLTNLSTDNNGVSDFILATEQTTERITSFFNKIRFPLLQQMTLAFSPTTVYDMCPLNLPDLFGGEQFVVTGRYKEAGIASATLAGKSGKGLSSTFNYIVEFTSDSMVNSFVPKFWAKYRIDVLSLLMAKETNNSPRWNEWKTEIIRLGLRFGLVTKFTSFSDPGGSNGGGTLDMSEERVVPMRILASPNPFRQSASFTVMIPINERITVTIYDAIGRVVCILHDGDITSGEHSFSWDGLDAFGQSVRSGCYYVEVTSSSFHERGLITKSE